MRIFLIFCFVLNHSIGFTQFSPAQLITSADGLPSNNTTCLFMDSKQMLWVGTQQGLAVFHHGESRVVQMENGSPILNAWSIVEDPNGKIWVGTYGQGLYCFNGQNWSHFDCEDALGTNQIRVLKIHKNGLWIGTKNCVGNLLLNKANPNNIALKCIKKDAGIVTSFFMENDSLFYANLSGKLYSTFKDLPVDSIESKGLIHCFADSKMKFFMNKGYYHCSSINSTNSKSLKNKVECNSLIWDMEYVNGTYFGAGWGDFENNGGLYSITSRGCLSINKKYGINANDIISLASDSENNLLYAASKTKGVFIVDLKQSITVFPFFSENNLRIVDFSGKNELPVFLTDKGIVNTYQKENLVVNRKDFKDFQNKVLANRKQPLPKREDGYFELIYETPSSEIVFYKLKQGEKCFWVNTNIGVFKLSLDFEFLAYIPVHCYVFNLSSEGNLMEAIPYNGVRVYTDNDESKATFFPDSISSSPKSVTDIKAINGYSFFGSVFYGITVFDGEEMVPLLHNEGFTVKNIRYLDSFKDSLLVVSTDFGSVYFFNASPPFNVVDSISPSKLYGNTIQFITTDSSAVYIGMLNGINVYKDGKISFWNDKKGIPDEIIKTGKVIGKQLFVGSEESCYSINTKDLSHAQKLSRAFVKEFKVNNYNWQKAKYDWFELEESIITLEHNQNTLSLNFGIDCNQTSNLFKYRYRLNDNGIWSEYFTTPEILLPFLSFGKYSIAVEATDIGSGEIFILPLLDININPPFYRTIGFYVLLVTGLIFMTVLIIKQREKFIRKHERQKALINNELEQSKLQALLSQMNPHFIFNAMNSVQSFILTNNKEMALKSLSEFSSLTRETLRNSQSNYISISREIAYLKKYIAIEQVRFGDRIRVFWDIDLTLDIDEIEIPGMTLQPLIENVFVHGFSKDHSAPELTITVFEEGANYVVFRVTDNGVGFDENQQKLDSKGIQLIKKRLSLLSGRTPHLIHIQSQINHGTTVEIKYSIT